MHMALKDKHIDELLDILGGPDPKASISAANLLVKKELELDTVVAIMENIVDSLKCEDNTAVLRVKAIDVLDKALAAQAKAGPSEQLAKQCKITALDVLKEYGLEESDVSINSNT